MINKMFTANLKSNYRAAKRAGTRQVCRGREITFPLKTGSLRRLDSLVRKLEKQNIIEQYEKVINDQLDEGIVEKVDKEAENRVFYLPHKAVIRESAETTKLRIMYDSSARENERGRSLNECLKRISSRRITFGEYWFVGDSTRWP